MRQSLCVHYTWQSEDWTACMKSCQRNLRKLLSDCCVYYTSMHRNPEKHMVTRGAVGCAHTHCTSTAKLSSVFRCGHNSWERSCRHGWRENFSFLTLFSISSFSQRIRKWSEPHYDIHFCGKWDARMPGRVKELWVLLNWLMIEVSILKLEGLQECGMTDFYVNTVSGVQAKVKNFSSCNLFNL